MQQIERESEVGFLPEEKIFIGNRQFRSKRQATETPLCGGFGPRRWTENVNEGWL
jgi:hypothetical protein